MPYKHIAAHLHKTELACRLHFHQMSYGSNRRKRVGSISSTCSSSSFNPLAGLRESSPEHPLSTINSPPSSPESSASGLANLNYESPALPQRPILPKPIMNDNRPMLPSSAILTKSLHLDTSLSVPRDHLSKNAPIDYAKLQSLYLTHRNSFWTQIAMNYSSTSQYSAVELEAAFFAAQNSHNPHQAHSPPTPGPSPQMISHPSMHAPSGLSNECRTFSAINVPTRSETVTCTQSPTERCAVSGLLN